MKNKEKNIQSKNDSLIDLKVTPYGFKENFLWLIRRFLSRMDRDNDANIRYIPKRLIVDASIKKELTLIFTGDWLDLRGKNIKLGKHLKKFIRKSDYFILNLEKLITEENTWKEERLHKPSILETISELFTPEKTVISLANNHAGDRGEEMLEETLSMIEARGFNVIGVLNQPYIDLYDDFRIVGATKWSNLSCEYIVPIDSSSISPKTNSFNILFPHWGYEFELFPRKEDVKLARSYAEQFDAIIGHHSHCPQPVNIDTIQDKEKLVAYSLGTFCTGRKSVPFKYGILLKVSFGRDSLNQWKIRKIKWTATKCSNLARKGCKVEIIKKLPFFRRKSSVYQFN